MFIYFIAKQINGYVLVQEHSRGGTTKELHAPFRTLADMRVWVRNHHRSHRIDDDELSSILSAIKRTESKHG